LWASYTGDQSSLHSKSAKVFDGHCTKAETPLTIQWSESIETNFQQISPTANSMETPGIRETYEAMSTNIHLQAPRHLVLNAASEKYRQPRDQGLQMSQLDSGVEL
jgi:hypothetical protein